MFKSLKIWSTSIFNNKVLNGSSLENYMRLNTTKHKTTQHNMAEHEYNTTQHDYNITQHEYNTRQHETRQVQLYFDLSISWLMMMISYTIWWWNRRWFLNWLLDIAVFYAKLCTFWMFALLPAVYCSLFFSIVLQTTTLVLQTAFCIDTACYLFLHTCFILKPDQDALHDSPLTNENSPFLVMDDV